MRARKILYFATLVYGLMIIQSGNLPAVAQPPANPQPPEQPTPAQIPAAEGDQKPPQEKPKKDSEKPEDVVDQESRPASENNDASEGTEELPQEDKPLTEQQLADAKAILSTSEQIALAYEKGDAAIGAAQFTEDAEYVDEYGNVFRGRAEIQRLLTEYFAEHPSCRLEIDVESIRFVGAGVAVEDGETTVMHRDHASAENDTTAAAYEDHSQESGNNDRETSNQPSSKAVAPSGDDQTPMPTPAAPSPSSATTPGEESPKAKDDQPKKDSQSEPSSGKDPGTGEDVTKVNDSPASGEASAQPSINSDAIDPSLLENADSEHNDSGSATVRSRYSAVYTNVEGKWLIASLRDFPHEERREHHAQLQSLNWLLGDWIDESDDSLVHFSCEPSDNGNFLIRTFSIVIDGEESLSGTQRIGWCPVSGKLRAWIFDSEGGYADGFWHRDGDDWVLKCTGVTADGETASYTSVYRILNEHTTTWQYVDYEIAGERLPDSEVFTIVQTPPTPTPTVADGSQ